MPNSVEDIITEVIQKEGGASVSNDPSDKGGRTQYGISEKANPEAWADGKVTEDEARAIYEKKYVYGPGFDKIADQSLRTQLIDFGVNSGPAIAVMSLQKILGVTVDGIIGSETLTALGKIHPDDVNIALAASRIKMIGRIVTKSPSQLKFLNGWLDRALSFIE